MNQIPFGRAVRSAVLLCGIATAVAPAAALASTYSVDDDKQQCPNAAFSSIQAAVNQAAPHDTIKVCAGVYRESSTPVSSAANPVQPGSHNGLTITKPLNIVGAGADKVTIEPAPSLGITLAGTDALGTAVPYLRDGGGNVITISRQSLGATDADENGVNISGVTVESPNTYAEADVAFFNTSGSITNSVIGPIASPTSVGSSATNEPYGYGVVQTDSLQGTGPGTGTVRRQVSVTNSLVTGYQAGGILFDDSYAPTAAVPTARSGIIAYGYVDHTRVVGDGSTPGQVGIEYRAGQQGSITSSEITGNVGSSTNSRTGIVTNSYGVLLADADTRAQDPDNPAVPSFFMNNDSITNNTIGLYNGGIDVNPVGGGSVSDVAPALANGSDGTGKNWWGCATGPVDIGTPPAAGCQTISGLDTNTPPAESVTAGVLTSPPAALSVPGPTSDDAPGVAIVDPLDGSTVTAGIETDPVVVPTDAFGISSVSLTADGAPVGTVGHTPYEFAWTPTGAEIGSTVALTATATNAAGLTTSTTIHVTVAAPAGYQPVTVAPTALDFGSLTVGTMSTKPFAVTDSGLAPVTLTGLDVAGSGFAIVPGSSTCTTTTTLAPGGSCTVTVSFDPVAVAAHAGYVKVSSSTPGSPGSVMVALTGTGTATAPVAPVKPTIDGSAVVGKTLTCSTSTPGVSYQWLRGSTAIAKATKPAYELVRADADSQVSCKVTSGSASATSASRLVTYPKSTTKTKITTQDGPAILALTRSIKGGSKLTIGTAECIRAAAKTCTVTVTGTLKIGTSSYKVSLKKSVARGKTASLTITLSSKAAKALKAKAGTLKLKIAVRDNTGSTSSVSATLETKRA